MSGSGDDSSDEGTSVHQKRKSQVVCLSPEHQRRRSSMSLSISAPRRLWSAIGGRSAGNGLLCTTGGSSYSDDLVFGEPGGRRESRFVTMSNIAVDVDNTPRKGGEEEESPCIYNPLRLSRISRLIDEVVVAPRTKVQFRHSDNEQEDSCSPGGRIGGGFIQGSRKLMSLSTKEGNRHTASCSSLQKLRSDHISNSQSVTLAQKASLRYLREKRNKQSEKELELDSAIAKGKRDNAVEALKKMGEATAWAESLGLKQHYKVHSDEKDRLFCQVFDENDNLTDEMSFAAFLRSAYPRLRTRYITHIGRPGVPEISKSRRKILCNASLPFNDKRRAAREEELRSALLSTLQLTDLLKEQLEVLSTPLVG